MPRTTTDPARTTTTTTPRSRTMPHLENIKGLSDTAMRLFAADCAEHVLHLYEREHPGDTRPREAIAAARAYARGEIGGDELTAARYATWVAARDAGAARLAFWDAGYAAGAAAWAAARVAALAAADTVAESATEAAARAAAGASARAAAWDAELRWQTERLQEYLDKDATDTE